MKLIKILLMPFLVMIFAFILLNTNTSNAEKTSIEIQNPKLTIEQQEEIKRNLNSFDKQMEKELNYAKEKGKKWINDTNQDEEVFALITLNENITLDEIDEFANKNKLKVQQINFLYDIGNSTFTGGYSLEDGESLEDSIRLAKKITKERLVDHLEALKRYERADKSEESKLKAKQKLTAVKQFIESNGVEKKLVYGLKVKGKKIKLKELHNNKSIHAVSKSEKNAHSTPLLREIPENWKGKVK